MKELAKPMAFRSDFYRFLSSLFLREVSLEILRNLSFLERTSLAEKIEKGKGLIPSKDQNVTDLKEELDVDFARIFLGLGPSPAFPYESVYRGRTGLLMQEPFDQVRDFYERAGIKKSPDLKEHEDHIGIELAFMANLSSLTEMALKNDGEEEALNHLERQREFLQNHLVPWIPALCADIERAAQTEFYKSLADLLTSWILFDVHDLNHMIGCLKK